MTSKVTIVRRVALSTGALALAAVLGAGVGIVTTTALQGASASAIEPAITGATLSDTRALAFEVNRNGQTIGEYGVGLKGDAAANPELIRAVGKDGTAGYVYTTEVFGVPAANPEEAVRQQEDRDMAAYLDEREVPLYAEDGRTVLGVYLANASQK